MIITRILRTCIKQLCDYCPQWRQLSNRQVLMCGSIGYHMYEFPCGVQDDEFPSLQAIEAKRGLKPYDKADKEAVYDLVSFSMTCRQDCSIVCMLSVVQSVCCILLSACGDLKRVFVFDAVQGADSVFEVEGCRGHGVSQAEGPPGVRGGRPFHSEGWRNLNWALTK